MIRVVLVDDHRLFADGLARLLGDESDIDVVAVVEEACGVLDTVARVDPHVVLLDHHLPGGDGIEIARAVKTLRPDIAVVMLTGTAEDRVLVAAIDAGCSGFLTKDRRPSEVADAVRAAAAGEVVMQPALLARLLPQLHRSHRAVGSDLTRRELEVLQLLVSGAANKEIATALHLSVNTIRNHVQAILTKLGAHSKLEAVATAVSLGIVTYLQG